MTECELLSIVETLKEFHNILLVQYIQAEMDHKNLAYKQFNIEHIMHWHLLKNMAPNLFTYWAHIMW